MTVDRLVDLVAAAARAGIDLIQIRERDLDARRLIALVRRCVEAAEGTSTKVLVNDRADVAVAAGAHGVHLRGDSIAAAAVRSLIGDGALIGRSVHGADEARAVSGAGGVDYLIFGTLYPSASKEPGTSCRNARRIVGCLSGQASRCSRSEESRSSGPPSRLAPGPPASPASACSCRRQGRPPIAICKPSRPSCGARLTHAGRFPNIDRPPPPKATARPAEALRAKAGITSDAAGSPRPNSWRSPP